MKRLLLTLALAGTACGADDVPIDSATPTTAAEPATTSTAQPSTTVAATTTTTEPVVEPEPATTPTVYVAPVTTAVRRATTSTVPVEPVSPQGRSTRQAGDFWWRLAACESENGRTSDNQFQFMGGTAEKVGYYPGASYEAQRAMAIGWASQIHPNEGTSAGWPVCWWVAGA